MSTLSTGLAMLGLAAVGMVGWQASRTATDTPAPIEVPGDPALSIALVGLPALPAALSEEPARNQLLLPPELGSNGLPCGLQLRAESQPPAMIALSVRDACRPGARYQLSHNGLTIDLESDAQGEVALMLPALSDPARVSLGLDGVEQAIATVDVADFEDYHRVGLAWAGEIGLSLHAHEQGAADRASGHVHPGEPGRAVDPVLGLGGFLSLVGNVSDGAVAQVYTYPRDLATDGGGVVRLSVALPACGGTQAAQRLETGPDGRMAVRAMELVLPDCSDATPQERLQNLYRDMRIAAR